MKELWNSCPERWLDSPLNVPDGQGRWRSVPFGQKWPVLHFCISGWSEPTGGVFALNIAGIFTRKLADKLLSTRQDNSLQPISVISVNIDSPNWCDQLNPLSQAVSPSWAIHTSHYKPQTNPLDGSSALRGLGTEERNSIIYLIQPTERHKMFPWRLL